jgi:hypothetical protein
LDFTFGANVWHIPYKLDARVMQLAAAGDFMNKGKVLIEWEKVEKKKKTVVQRWCVPTDLECGLCGRKSACLPAACCLLPAACCLLPAPASLLGRCVCARAFAAGDCAHVCRWACLSHVGLICSACACMCL